MSKPLLIERLIIMIAVKRPLLQPGQIVATALALESLEAVGQSAWEYLSRYISGDWGVVHEEDQFE